MADGELLSDFFKPKITFFFFNLEIDLLCDIKNPNTGTTCCKETSSTSVWQDKNVFMMPVYFAILGFLKVIGVSLICFRPPVSFSRLHYKYYSVDTETIGLDNSCLCGGKEKNSFIAGIMTGGENR